MNPARSFGPAVVGAKFPAHHEIYWIAPLLGGILSVIYFEILKACSYNSAVLDQDSDKEVSGLRPVHMRVYKRLAGHKDWERATEEVPNKRKLLRRRLRKAQAELEAHDEYAPGNDNYNDNANTGDDFDVGTDGEEDMAQHNKEIASPLPLPITTPVSGRSDALSGSTIAH